MDNKTLLTKVRAMQHEFVSYWVREVCARFPRRYDEARLYSLGETSFHYITDLHLAVEEHPIKYIILDKSRYLQKHQIHTIDIFDAIQLWRKTLLEVGEGMLTLSLFKEMSYRIDFCEEIVFHDYWNRAMAHMQNNTTAITQHHDDRISLLGKMAASMAHEIRNPMTSIKGFLQLLRTNISQHNYERADTYLDFIDNECDNILMQVTGFLSFSKKPINDEEKVQIPLKQVLDHNLSLLNPRLINENVDLSVVIPSDILLKVQKMAIQQVFSNILNNGIDAMTEMKHNKKITIECIEDNRCIYIDVSNNGPRIPEEMDSTIFSPFVTDKENGTGLGLAICKQIMLKNDGDITFTSSDFETTFRLIFNKLDAEESTFSLN
jgi:two-component system, sporulation sensor kinase D